MNIFRIFVVLLCFTPVVLAQNNSPAFQIFEQAVRFIDTQYFGPSELNIQNLGEKYRALLTTACIGLGDACDFDKAEPVIAAMLAELSDRHAYYLTAAQVQSRNATQSGVNNSPAPILGFTHQPMLGADQKLLSYDRLIVNVLPNSPSDIGGLRYGDRWIGFDDTVFSNLTNDAEYTQALQNFTARVRSAQPFTMLVLRGLERQRLELKMQGAIFNQAQLPSLTVRPDNIAVLRLRTFAVSKVGQRVHDLLDEISGTKVRGLILDMRGNGGGLASERWFTAGAFIQDPEPQRRVPRQGTDTLGFEESYQRGRYIVKSLTGTELQNQRLEFYTRFDGPVSILVDGGCASACEFLSSSFRRAKRAFIVGEPTAGIGNTNTQGFALQNGGAVSIPTLRSYWTDNTWLPAQIIPDIMTPQADLELFNTGRDIPIEKALELINKAQ